MKSLCTQLLVFGFLLVSTNSRGPGGRRARMNSCLQDSEIERYHFKDNCVIYGTLRGLVSRQSQVAGYNIKKATQRRKNTIPIDRKRRIMAPVPLVCGMSCWYLPFADWFMANSCIDWADEDVSFLTSSPTRTPYFDKENLRLGELGYHQFISLIVLI